MVVSSGDAFWAELSDEKFEDVKFSPETRALLENAIFFEPLPFVTRVIFIATPHRGSFLAENWLGMLARKLASAPGSLAKSGLELARLSKDPHLFRSRFQISTSIDSMDWSKPGVRTLASLPIAPAVHVNSIIRRERPDERATRRRARQSAHIEPVESESGSARATDPGEPETIEEVRRIPA
jgi:hypothetical protein